MKLRHFGQAALAGAVSLGIVLGIGACGQDNTIDYVYVTNSKNNPGQINVFLVDHLSGTLTQIRESPYPSGGRNPVDIVATANGKYLYVANHDDSTVVQFAVGTDAKIYPQHTYATQDHNASLPTALAVNSAGTFLYVTNAFQSQYTASTPGPGALLVYPISQTDGSLGTPVVDTANGTPFFPTCNNPVAVDVLNNGAAVYVVDDPASQPPKLADTTSSSNVGANGTSTIQYTATAKCSATNGQISAFSVGAGSALTEITGSPFTAGTAPDAIVSDPQDRFVYVTDLLTNQLLAYVASGKGTLTPINNGPFTTGVYPDGITIDPTSQYIYVANYIGNSISAYSISTTGVPSAVASGVYAAKTGPTAVYIEPASGRYLYTSNFLDNTVSGLNLNPNNGNLNTVQNSPFPANGQPTSIAAVTHGSHAIEVLPQY